MAARLAARALQLSALSSRRETDLAHHAQGGRAPAAAAHRLVSGGEDASQSSCPEWSARQQSRIARADPPHGRHVCLAIRCFYLAPPARLGFFPPRINAS